MQPVVHLPEKLALLLKAMSLSRVALARQMGVDKSLVGRWLAGNVHPTEHNLARLAQLAATAIPGFTLADWYHDTHVLADRLGIAAPPPANPAGLAMPALLREFLEIARPETEYRASAYEGFWRSSRASALVGERLFHEYGIIRRSDDGLLEVRMIGSGLLYRGWVFPIGTNVFVYMLGDTGRTPVSVLFKGVSLPKAMVLDGMLMLAALDSDRTPAVLPVVIERVGDTTDDRAADLARFHRMTKECPEPLHPVPVEQIESRIFRDTGPEAAARGGEAVLSVGGMRNLSRGIAGDDLTG